MQRQPANTQLANPLTKSISPAKIRLVRCAIVGAFAPPTTSSSISNSYFWVTPDSLNTVRAAGARNRWRAGQFDAYRYL